MSYKFTTIIPDERLATVVKNFFIIEFDSDETCIDYLLPDGLPSFFYFHSNETSGSHFRNDQQTFFLSNGFHVGYSNAAFEFVHKRAVIFGISVFPIYFKTILGKSLSDIIN